MFNPATPSAVSQANSQALQACIQIALAEGGAIARRWVQGLVKELRVREGEALSYSAKTSITQASKELVALQDRLESRFVVNWKNSIDLAIQGAAVGQASTARRSLSQIRFDELELMDDVQVQATVETARVQQAVQAASEQALGDLSARLSRAQGYGVVRTDQNPLRPEVVIQALNNTLMDVCKTPATRGLWLQHGSKVLATELESLYRYLRKVLDEHGVKPAEYAVTSAPPAPSDMRGRGSVAGGSLSKGTRSATGSPYSSGHPPVFDQLDEGPGGYSGGADFRPSSLLTLNHLHKLIVSGQALSSAPGDNQSGYPESAKTPLMPGFVAGVARDSVASAYPSLPVQHLPPDSVVEPPVPETPLPPIYMGAERRRRTRTGQVRESIDPNEAGQLADLAEEVVGMMLDGIYRDKRLLPPVRDALQRLRPLFLRIAKHTPKFFADKQNPARQLLDEMTQQSLAFSSVQSPGFDVYLRTLGKVVESLVQDDGLGTARLTQALYALRTDVDTVVSEERKQAQKRAVTTLMKAEKRFLLAEKVATEMRARKDFAYAPAFLQHFLAGPWSQVIAWARLARSGDDHPSADGRLSADVRYIGLIGNLVWSSRPELAARSRSRLVSSIPVMLRTLREGLQTIEYPQEKSCDFFNQLMSVHDAALKISATPSPTIAEQPPVEENEDVVAESVPTSPAGPALAPLSVRTEAEMWVSPTETRDTGFMEIADMAVSDPPHPAPDFEDTQPMTMPMTPQPPEDVPPSSDVMYVSDLAVGSWVEWLAPSGEWQRAKLSWASPQGTMYLFIVAGGKSISMTRRSLEAMCQRESVRLVSARSMVDDALDGVVAAAVRNSTDTVPGK